MGTTTAIDLQAALIAHLHWKSKLSDFFYGLEDLNVDDVADHTNCDFGKWLYSRGLKELSGIPEAATLEQLHQEVHESIRDLVTMPQEQRNSEAGQQHLVHFHGKCDRLLELLERMEQQVKQQQR